MPSPLEYLTEHAQYAYPFKDICTRQGTNAQGFDFTLPDDWFLDLMFVVYSGPGRRVYLNHISSFVDVDEVHKYSLEFKVYDMYGVLVDTVNAVFLELTPFVTATYATDKYGVKLVPGEGIATLTEWTSVSTWEITQRASSSYWTTICSSADGSILLANNDNGPAYLSTNSGVTWTVIAGLPSNGSSFGCACSSDGSKMFIAYDYIGGTYNSDIYTSYDTGVTWTSRSPGVKGWYSIACSSDGTKLLASSAREITPLSPNVYYGYLYQSTDSGVTWTQGNIPNSWGYVVSSADGTKLYAVDEGPGTLYRSMDSGLTWETIGPTGSWFPLACSGDGVNLIAAMNGGFIYISHDSGSTWTPGSISGDWYAVASSSDGRRLAAATYDYGLFYTSDDYGVSWFLQPSSHSWYCIASSANGRKLALGSFNGYIYMAEADVTYTGIQDYTFNSPTPQYVFTQRDSTRQWSCCASSADGVKLVSCVLSGQIYTSTDSGMTWSPRDFSRSWNSCASSADGVKLVATAGYLGSLYTSIDSGVTWVSRTAIDIWGGCASSADGTKLVATRSGGIQTSTDSGVTWIQRSPTIHQWISCASSSDGVKLVATAFISGQGPGQIYTSTDSGVTWILRDSTREWAVCSSSADGTRLLATAGYDTLYTSMDSGVTWISTGEIMGWARCASSSDGTKLIAAEFDDVLHVSSDSGANWARIPITTVNGWSGVASSADGTKLIAVDQNGYIYTGLVITPPFVLPAELQSDVIMLPFEKASSITFKNYEEDVDIAVITPADAVYTLQGGANVNLLVDSGNVTFDVLAGEGTGLYDGCTTETDVIKTINGIGPASNGDFALFGDQCFNILKHQASIELQHTCEPKCTEDQIKALAYYINRLRDAIVQAGELVVSRREELAAQMAAYQSKLNLMQKVKAPFLQVNHSRTGNSLLDFLSYNVVVNNPNNSALTGGLVVSTDIPGFTYLAGSGQLHEGGTNQAVNQMGFILRTIPCLSYVSNDFVISGAHNVSVLNRAVRFQFKEVGVPKPGSAFFYSVVFPSKVYFNVSCTKVWDYVLSKYKYTFTVDFLDTSISTGSSTRPTNFALNLPSALTYTTGTLILNKNNIKSVLPNTTPNRVAFNGESINYAQKAQLTFEATATVSVVYAITTSVTTTAPVASFGAGFNIE